MSTNEQDFGSVRLYKLNSDDPDVERVLSIPFHLIDHVRVDEFESADARLGRLGLLS